jgi:hypothetical protein
VGENVPPPPPSLGVIVTGSSIVVSDGNATVNVAAAPMRPEVGPVSTYVVAGVGGTMFPLIAQRRK